MADAMYQCAKIAGAGQGLKVQHKMIFGQAQLKD